MPETPEAASECFEARRIRKIPTEYTDRRGARRLPLAGARRSEHSRTARKERPPIHYSIT
jgi:hypothetical protein